MAYTFIHVCSNNMLIAQKLQQCRGEPRYLRGVRVCLPYCMEYYLWCTDSVYSSSGYQCARRGGSLRSESLGLLLGSHRTVGVALFGSKVSDRLSSLCM